MLGQSAGGATLTTFTPIDSFSLIPDFIPSGSNLLFYYDFGIPYSYPQPGNLLRDLVTGTRLAEVYGGQLTGSNGGEIILQTGSYIDFGTDSIYDIGDGPITILVSFMTLDTGSVNNILNKKLGVNDGPGYIVDAKSTNLHFSGSSNIGQLNTGPGSQQLVTPGQLGLAVLSYASGSGLFISPFLYSTGIAIRPGGVTYTENSFGGGQGTVTNNLPLYIGRDNAGTEFSNIKVQAIWGYDLSYSEGSLTRSELNSSALRNNFTSSRV